MADIVQFSAGLVGDGIVIDPDQILREAIGAGYTHLVLIAHDGDSKVDIRSSHGLAESLLLMERAKVKMVGHG